MEEYWARVVARTARQRACRAGVLGVVTEGVVTEEMVEDSLGPRK